MNHMFYAHFPYKGFIMSQASIECFVVKSDIAKESVGFSIYAA